MDTNVYDNFSKSSKEDKMDKDNDNDIEKNREKGELELEEIKEIEEMEEIEEIETFEDLNLKDNLLRGIYAMGFENPSPIQQRAIKPIIMKRDVLTQSQSGTGKTATFSIGILELLDEKLYKIQSIILSPARELAQQTYDVISTLSNFMKIKIHMCVGGMSLKDDIKNISEGTQIIVGTPGRIYDLILKGIINTNNLKNIVLDEADEMLSNNFKLQIKDIFKYVPKTAQVILISATLPEEVKKISTYILQNPIEILVKKEQLTLEGIQQYYINLDAKYKYDTLCDLYQHIMVTQSIIFCNKKETVDQLTNDLKKNGFTVASIHSNMTQDLRTDIMDKFRNGIYRILISTDLLGRGIDIQQVSLVINYDIPTKKESYIHRVGRGGRFGRKSVAITFVTQYDTKILQDLQNFYKTSIEELPANIDEIINTVSYKY